MTSAGEAADETDEITRRLAEVEAAERSHAAAGGHPAEERHLLDQRGAQSESRRGDGRRHAGRPAAHDDDVELGRDRHALLGNEHAAGRHDQLPVSPARSRSATAGTAFSSMSARATSAPAAAVSASLILRQRPVELLILALDDVLVGGEARVHLLGELLEALLAVLAELRLQHLAPQRGEGERRHGLPSQAAREAVEPIGERRRTCSGRAAR